MIEGRFEGKVVLVTGGGSGIGAATAHRFGSEGATVVVAGRAKEKISKILREAAHDVTLVGHIADVSDERQVTELINQIAAEYGRLDTLVNNAGIYPMGTVEQVGTAVWRQAMATNIDGVFFASRAALPHLRAVSGSIVNVGSAGGLGGDWGVAAYNTSKAAVTNLTNAMALDHGGEGVRVNAVHPGLTVTDMSAAAHQNEQAMAAFRNRIPLGRAAEPSEIAAVIAFLASADASFVNGAHIRVDGGSGASNGNPNLQM